MTRARLGMLAIAGVTTIVGVAGSADAHEVRPGFLQLRESEPGIYAITWKVPALGEMRLRLDPVFPETCVQLTPPSRHADGGAYIDTWSIECAGGLEGKTIEIAGLRQTLTDVMVRLQPADDGPVQTYMLRSVQPTVVIGAAGEAATPMLGYFTIGVEHILLGIDHLLFVLGLLLIVKDRWMLLETITSFTVAHSITLGIATLGFASAPVAPLNAAIALSILFLGPEIVRSWRGETSFTIEHPWVVAFAFGLLHGFGFASGLNTVGLPGSEIPLALLFFNLGVEAGQVGFVALVIGLERAFAALQIRWPRWAEIAPGYVVGSLGAYWTIQRTLMMLGGSR